MLSQLLFLAATAATAVQAAVLPTDTFDTTSIITSRNVLGEASIVNRCYDDLWLYSMTAGPDSGPIHLPARSRYLEPFKTSPGGGGTVFKVSRTKDLQAGKHVQFEYSISAGNLWYDTSFVDCAKGQSESDCSGWDKGILVDSQDKSCSPSNCKPGSYCPTEAYWVDTPVSKLGIAEPTKMCKIQGEQLMFKLCSSNSMIKL